MVQGMGQQNPHLAERVEGAQKMCGRSLHRYRAIVSSRSLPSPSAALSCHQSKRCAYSRERERTSKHKHSRSFQA